MISPEPVARARSRSRFAAAAILVVALGVPAIVNAQGLVQGVQKGAREGNKAAGPIGGVLGGAIGGVVGVVGGVLGGGKNGTTPPANDKGGAAKKDAKDAKSAKGAKGQKQPAVLTQTGAPQLTAEQIVANSDANIERIEGAELTPSRKSTGAVSAAPCTISYNGADRLNLRITRARNAIPDDIIEQMRNEAQFSTIARSTQCRRRGRPYSAVSTSKSDLHRGWSAEPRAGLTRLRAGLLPQLLRPACE